MLTTHRSPIEITYVNRGGSSEQKTVPTAVLDYNKHKGGVDTMDQLRGNYVVRRKSKRCWPQLVWWAIDMCILNAYSLYRQQQQVKISQLQFREQLIQQLVERYPQQRAIIGRPPRTPIVGKQQQHWPPRLEDRADCVYCSRQPDRRSRTRVRCDLCNVALCLDPCFKLFHTQH
jgi:hypothetical protein